LLPYLQLNMKPLIITLTACLLNSFMLSAQNCTPDGSISDTLFGVFPMPYDKDVNPTGGIQDTACENHSFEFVFTTQVGDSFTLGQTTLALDSLWLDKDDAVTGLPKGLKYSCNPPSCVFTKQSTGCVKLYGVPENGTEGIHQMTLSGKLYAGGSSFGLPLSFPDENIAPGEYAILVGNPDESPCKALSIQENVSHTLEVYPNPAHDRIQLKSPEAGVLTVFDMYGRLQYASEVEGVSYVDVKDWSKGIYLLRFQGEEFSQYINLLVD